MSSGAASDAASAQASSADKAIQFQQKALDTTRGDLAPYRDAGTTALYGGPEYDQGAYDKAVADFNALPLLGGKSKTNKKTGVTTTSGKGTGYLTLAQYQALPADQRIQYEKNAQGNFTRKAPQLSDYKNPTNPNSLLSLVTDPNAQKNYITNNPFFDSLANKASQTLFQNAAAKGKLGTGGTAEALQNSILLLGNDLLNQNIAQRQTIANLGEDAAARSGNASQTAANSISDLTTQKGNAQAAGAIGGANAWNSALGNVSSLLNPQQINLQI
jgi:hypothetical protein